MAEMKDTQQDQEKLLGPAMYWQNELEKADLFERDWRERGMRVVERYRDEREGRALIGPSNSRFNILWANTETLKGAMLARMAEPDVRRRFPDVNPAGRQVAILLERALSYGLDVYDGITPMKSALEDYLLPGRGVVWVVYEPVIIKEKIKIEVKSEDVSINEQEEVERLGDQRCRFEYVHWQDYRESPSRRAEDATWRARRHLFTRDDLIGRGFKDAHEIPLNWMPDTNEDNADYGETYNRAEVWEIWCKVTRKRLFVATGYKDVLAEDDDPYELESFFPTPTPLIAVRTNDTSVPVPEFTMYQDQADELDRVTNRIAYLVEALKRRGVYDASVPELAQLAMAGDNDFVPSDNFASLAQKGGLAGVFQTEDTSTVSTTLGGLYTQRTQVLQIIYEVTGISDIIRGGGTKASESATAQQLKAQYGSMRLRRRQDEIEKYIRALYRIKAELIAENYEPEILERITGIEVTDEMLEIMRNDKLRNYQIDVETDSTIFANEEETKRTRIEFASVFGDYLVKAIEATRAAPEITPIAFEMLKFVSGAWKIGRNFEDVIDQTEAQVMQQLQAMQQQPPQPSPEEAIQQQKIMAELEREKLKQEGKLADISSRERSKAAEIEEESRASDQRVRSKEDLAMLDAELRMAERDQ
mgnify:CR=1|jgi:hypothetical protein|tara:strand:+ start:3307 stop:5244 length:1938 start_codon:yes stop_codon:yes gene_type:complete